MADNLKKKERHGERETKSRPAELIPQPLPVLVPPLISVLLLLLLDILILLLDILLPLSPFFSLRLSLPPIVGPAVGFRVDLSPRWSNLPVQALV